MICQFTKSATTQFSNFYASFDISFQTRGDDKFFIVFRGKKNLQFKNIEKERKTFLLARSAEQKKKFKLGGK